MSKSKKEVQIIPMTPLPPGVSIIHMWSEERYLNTMRSIMPLFRKAVGNAYKAYEGSNLDIVDLRKHAGRLAIAEKTIRDFDSGKLKTSLRLRFSGAADTLEKFLPASEKRDKAIDKIMMAGMNTFGLT